MKIYMHKRYFVSNYDDFLSYSSIRDLLKCGMFSMYNEDYVELDLDEWSLFVDDMYGPIIHPSNKSIRKYNLPPKGSYHFFFYYDMSLCESKEEIKMKCDLEMPHA